MDFFNPATHTCWHCDSVILDGSRLLTSSDEVSFDLATTCDQAIAAAKSGCQFFQHILHPVWPESKDVAPQLRFSFRREKGKRTRVVVCIDFVSTKYELKIRDGDRTVALPRVEKVSWLSDGDLKHLHGWTRAIFAAYVAPENWEWKGLDHFELPPNLNMLSQRAMVTARGWLKDCVAGHKRCAGEETHRFPSRLLEIGPNDTARVVVTSQVVPYVCLSYCWGGDQVKSTRRNILGHMAGLRVSTLSKSIRDAIAVTMILGLRYIWIDALCIIQDDPTDTAMEVAKMSDIYERALLTLSAGGASRSNDGFLGVRDPSTIFKIKVRGPRDRLFEMLLDPLSPILSGKQPADPLNTRAWTLQETLLSRRILYFSPKQLIWKCVECELSDGGYIENVFPMRTQWYKLETASEPDHLRFLNPSLVNDQMRSVRWWQIVEEYSSRAMTSSSDKLVAIAAVAESFQRLIPIQEKRGWRYLAGLWEKTLLRDLVWSPAGVVQGELLPERPPYRAPSWSWASVDCKVSVVASPDSFQKRYNLVIDDVHVEPKSWDSRFGAIVDARLTVTGMTKIMTDCQVVLGGLWLQFYDEVTEYFGILGLDAREPVPEPGSQNSLTVTLLQVENFQGSAPDFSQTIIVLRQTGRSDEFQRLGSLFLRKSEIHRWEDWDASFTEKKIEIV